MSYGSCQAEKVLHGLGEGVTKVANTATLNNEQSDCGRRYTHYTGGQGAKIAKYAAECGNLATIMHFKNEFLSLGETQRGSLRSNTATR